MVKETYTRTYKDDGGVTHTWYYKGKDLFKVTIDYPKGHMSDAEEQKLKNKKLPKTKQRFTNPITGKEISHQRYQQLIKEGKIKKQ